MARQEGIIKIKGTLNDVTFYKSADGYMARMKGGVDAGRIANDPAFQRTRENGAEFGRAGKAGRVLRTAIRPLLTNVRDRYSTARLAQLMVKVIQADATNPRGLRNVIDGESELLAGFEFNRNGALGATLYAPLQKAINRTTGEITLTVAPYVPTEMVVAPSGTTHFRIVSAGSAIDFEAETYQTDVKQTAILPWDGTATTALTHTHALAPASTHPLFLLIGIVFYQEVNGQHYLLRNGAHNPLQIAMVDGD